MSAEIVVFSSAWLAEAHLVQSVLAREGLPARIRNGLVSGLAGEVPFDAVRVEVLVPVEHAAEAQVLVDEARAPAGHDQACPACGEENGAAFELCWQCGAELPPAPRLKPA